jgi:iron complex transport system permease protein
MVVPLTLLLSRPMRQLEMGDDVARASGVNANRTRLALMVLGVALTAIVTAAAGPISFIALAAPQIARRLTRSAGVVLIPSALMGGLLLLAADWAAQHAFGVQLPVGVMTVSIGGFYFVWLLIREGRK